MTKTFSDVVREAIDLCYDSYDASENRHERRVWLRLARRYESYAESRWGAAWRDSVFIRIESGSFDHE